MYKTISTGFGGIDKALDGGFCPGELTILAARPGMGKTAFACEIALNNAKAGKNVWIFSFNLSAEDLCWRLIAREAGIELMKLRRNDALTDEEMQKLSESARADINSYIFIYDRPFGFERIAEYMSEIVLHNGGADMVIVDDLRCTASHLAVDQKQNAYGIVCQQLSEMAMILNVPVICCDNLPHSVEMRDDKRPCLGDMDKEVSDKARNVIFLYRDSYYNDGAPEDECAVIVAKAHGECTRNNSVRLHWDGRYTCFSNWDDR